MAVISLISVAIFNLLPILPRLVNSITNHIIQKREEAAAQERFNAWRAANLRSAKNLSKAITGILSGVRELDLNDIPSSSSSTEIPYNHRYGSLDLGTYNNRYASTEIPYNHRYGSLDLDSMPIRCKNRRKDYGKRYRPKAIAITRYIDANIQIAKINMQQNIRLAEQSVKELESRDDPKLRIYLNKIKEKLEQIRKFIKSIGPVKSVGIVAATMATPILAIKGIKMLSAIIKNRITQQHERFTSQANPIPDPSPANPIPDQRSASNLSKASTEMDKDLMFLIQALGEINQNTNEYLKE